MDIERILILNIISLDNEFNRILKNIQLIRFGYDRNPFFIIKRQNISRTRNTLKKRPSWLCTSIKMPFIIICPSPVKWENVQRSRDV